MPFTNHRQKHELTYNETDFLLDGKPFVILSGAIHYFRIPRAYWYDRLLKLKECGLNTVETYVAWNAHEAHEGQFDFSDLLDLGAFLDIAAELGLYAIVRPGPFICAEWEGGGLPAWLLQVPSLRIRCDNQPFLEKVQAFFAKLFPILVPRLCTNGGNILMLQVENEYGSYGNDKTYLRKLEDMYRALGADCLLYRSDGDAPFMMEAADTGIYAADNFGSDPVWHMTRMAELGYRQPMFCGEYWCGWFDHWHERHHRRAASDVARELELFLQNNCSLNYYMFCGGTNFAFWNGANMDQNVYAPTTTSYDYDSLLNEAGDRTEKYYLVRDVLQKHPELRDGAPFPTLTATDSEKAAYGPVQLSGSALLFDHLDELNPQTSHTGNPLTMEQTGTNLGYILYTHTLSAAHGEPLRPEPVADRLQLFLDGKKFATLENGRPQDIPLLPEDESLRPHTLAILCENMGRVNYGWQTLDSKGLTRVLIDRNRGQGGAHYVFLNGWTTRALPMEDLSALTFGGFEKTDLPAFHRAQLHIDGAPKDTFLSTRGFHKGFVFVNGRNLGRYYTDAGPQYALYVPAPYLREGDNDIILFESERTETDTITFLSAPDFGE